MSSQIVAKDRLDRPYPLLRLFVRFVLPGIALLLVVSATLASVAARRFSEGVYLEQALKRAEVIARAIQQAQPGPWLRLKQGRISTDQIPGAEWDALIAELDGETRELGLKRLKIYAANAVIVYSTAAAQIGTIDRSAAYVAAAEHGKRTVVAKIDPDGSPVY